ncbi:MAG: hypothetical protein ABIH72_04885 [archaeon]
MGKITAWLVTFIGLLLIVELVLPLFSVMVEDVMLGQIFNWLLALAVLAVGINKLRINYSSK